MFRIRWNFKHWLKHCLVKHWLSERMELYWIYLISGLVYIVLNSCGNPGDDMSTDKTAYRELVMEPLIAVHFLPRPQLPQLPFLLRMHLSQHWHGKLHGFSSREIIHHNTSVQVACPLCESSMNAEKMQHGEQCSTTHVFSRNLNEFAYAAPSSKTTVQTPRSS